MTRGTVAIATRMRQECEHTGASSGSLSFLHIV
jgi:hypothetical protein